MIVSRLYYIAIQKHILSSVIEGPGEWYWYTSIPQGVVHKILIYHKQQIFLGRKEKAASPKSLPLKNEPDIDLVCQTSLFLHGTYAYGG